MLAAVKPARYLEAGNPTGITGLFTHPAPRSTLIYLYSSTLEKLKQLPESSVYRQSTEALTRNRLKIISSVVPAGFEEWAAKAKKIVAEHPEVFNTPEGGVDYAKGRHLKETFDGRSFVTTKIDNEPDEINDEWDGDEDLEPVLEGTRTTAERKSQAALGMKRPGEDEKQIKWDPEPPLSADQYVVARSPTSSITNAAHRISDVENQIGAGLIEEVIEVAEGELKLVQAMTKAKAYV
jgi:NADH dehydrogenase (ubiquinone) 1 alpha subcomplex subunit 5